MEAGPDGAPRRRQRRRERFVVLMDGSVLGRTVAAELAADAEVIAFTPDEAEAAAAAREGRADAVVLDGDAGDARAMGWLVGALAEAAPGTAVIALVGDVRGEATGRLLAAGAACCVAKSVSPDALVHVVRATLQGQLALGGGPGREGPGGPGGRLTSREAEILGLVAEGLPNREIARQLWITEPTVKFHVTKLLRKLQASNRTELAATARRLGLVDGTEERAGAGAPA